MAASTDAAGMALEEGTSAMMGHVVESFPVAAATHAGEQLFAEVKGAFKQSHADEEQNVPPPTTAAPTVEKCQFVRIKSPSSSGELRNYRWARLSVDSGKHVRLKAFPTESAWLAASNEPNATTPSIDDVKADEPLAIRHCTFTTTTRSVLLQAPNPGYTDADSGFIDRVLTVRKIKFDSHETAVEWARFLERRTGEDDGYPHVNNSELTGKVMQAAIQKFQHQQMGSPTSTHPTSPSNEAMAKLVLSHVNKVAVIPSMRDWQIPVINKPVPMFVKQRGFKTAAGMVTPKVEDKMTKAFHLCEMVVQELAGHVERFIVQLVDWVMEHIVQPIIRRFKGKAEPAEEKAVAEPSVRDRIIAKAKELSAQIPFAQLAAKLKTMLSAANISTPQPSSPGFDQRHFELIASSELERLVTQEANKAMHR